MKVNKLVLYHLAHEHPGQFNGEQLRLAFTTFKDKFHLSSELYSTDIPLDTYASIEDCIKTFQTAIDWMESLIKEKANANKH